MPNWTQSQRKRHRERLENNSFLPPSQYRANPFAEWNATKKEAKRLAKARKENAKKVAARLLGVRKHKPEIWEWKKSNE